MPEGEDEEVIVEKTPLQQQLEASAKLLEKLRIEGDEFVTNVRVANDEREVDRREEEGTNREKIIAALEEEAAAAYDAFTVIADRWTSILKYKDPLHINDEIINQTEKCNELIKQKDEVIAMLKNEIKHAEVKFANDQKKQIDDIEQLTNRIERQVSSLLQFALMFCFNHKIHILSCQFLCCVHAFSDSKEQTLE